MSKLNIVLIFICILNQSCFQFSSSKNNTTKSKKVEDTVTSINSEFAIPKKINKDLILDKTFYYVTKTDSGHVVMNHYKNGFDGFTITKRKLINFGFETFSVDIDSIVSDYKQVILYASSISEDEYGDVYKNTGLYLFVPQYENKGVFEMDNKNIVIDSAYAGKTFPIVKEKPYDIEEAIGDF